MATFEISLGVNESKSGSFMALVSPGSTLSLGADSAARVTVSFPDFFGNGILEIDNNEGGDGDSPNIANGETSYTIPEFALAGGEVVSAIVSWEAYNWRGPGSISIDGFAELGDSVDSVGKSTLRFIPEGGSQTVTLYVSEPQNTPIVRVVGPNADLFSCASVPNAAGYLLTVSFDGIPETKEAKLSLPWKGNYVLAGGKRIDLLVDYAITDPGGYRDFAIRNDGELKKVCFPSVAQEMSVSVASKIEGTRLKAECRAGWITLVNRRFIGGSLDGSEVFYEELLNPAELAYSYVNSYGTTVRAPGIQVLVRVGENTSGNDREAEIRIIPENSSLSVYTFKVVQFAQNVQVDAPSLSISPQVLPFAAEGGSSQISVTANSVAGTVTATASESWLSATPNGLIVVQRNHGEARAGTIVFSGENGGSAVLYVEQAEENSSEPSVRIAPKTLNFDASGGARQISVAANTVAGTVSTDISDSWIMASPYGSIRVEANSGEARTGTVVFSGANGGTGTLTISQASYVETATVSLSPDTLDFTAAGGEAQIRITGSPAAGAISVSGPEWIDATPGGVIRVAANTTAQAREATLEFIGGNMVPGSGATLLVRQAAPAPSLSVSVATLLFSANAGTKSVSVSANASAGKISVSSSDSWLSATGTGQISVSANSESVSRVGIVYFSGANGGSVAVRVTQEGKEPDSFSEQEDIIWRGNKDKIYIKHGSVSGNVSETGENWSIVLFGSREAVRRYMKRSNTPGLFRGSAWSPVALPSRNTPVISGWTLRDDGKVSILEIKYAFDADTFYFSSDSDEPTESIKESIASTVIAVPLTQAEKIWGMGFGSSEKEDARCRGIMVEYTKALLSIRPSSENYEELKRVWNKNFCKDMGWQEDFSTDMEAHPQVVTLRKYLAAGIDMVEVAAYTVSVEEILNKEPNPSGLNTYNEPPLKRLSLPNNENSKYWYQNRDDVSTVEGGQFQRIRTWIGVAVKSDLYEG